MQASFAISFADATVMWIRDRDNRLAYNDFKYPTKRGEAIQDLLRLAHLAMRRNRRRIDAFDLSVEPLHIEGLETTHQRRIWFMRK
ncbi:hypothetical protein PQQ81_09475 [Paraburkholderia strydomiana]|uniref:hypothetical protein n=1 Tax=Paraburkholderia strydomiana TaxID=1245417 RepID=UPI0038B8776A